MGTNLQQGRARDIEAYFRATVAADADEEKAPRVAWRLSCFASGASYADFVQEQHFPLRGRRVLDLACAWGGHGVAFATRGAQVTAADLNDHQFASLSRFARTRGVDLVPLRASCEELPFNAETFDVVLAFELIEHIRSPQRLAFEVARVLRPGGVCLLSTPPRLRSVIHGEPHYDVKGLPLLPFPLQGWVATKLLRRSYPFPITRQYSLARGVIAPFAQAGLRGKPVLRGRRLAQLNRTPLRAFAEQLLWAFIVLTKEPVRAAAAPTSSGVSFKARDAAAEGRSRSPRWS